MCENRAAHRTECSRRTAGVRLGQEGNRYVGERRTGMCGLILGRRDATYPGLSGACIRIVMPRRAANARARNCFRDRGRPIVHLPLTNVV